MPRLHDGDVVQYRPGRTLEPQIGTVRKVHRASVELYCGGWILRKEVLCIVRRLEGPMPSPSSISTAMLHGGVVTQDQDDEEGTEE